MGLKPQRFTPVQYAKWQLFYMLLNKTDHGNLPEKEDVLFTALNLDTPAEELWSHVLWLLGQNGGDKRKTAVELKFFAMADIGWAEKVIEIALKEYEAEELTQPNENQKLKDH